MQSVEIIEQGSTDHDYHLPQNILHQDPVIDHDYYQTSPQALPVVISVMDAALGEIPHPEDQNDPIDPAQMEIRELTPTIEEPSNPNLPIIIPTKRKRSHLNTPKAKNQTNNEKGSDEDDDEDEGLTCPICLDSWEMSGEHRLVSLKCGHLFGESCIRRWLTESGRTGQKACPQCKSRALHKDIRCLYAKRLRAIDRSEEHRLREQIEVEKMKSTNIQADLVTLKISYTMIMSQMQKLQDENERLKKYLRNGLTVGFFNETNSSSGSDYAEQMQTYKLFMEKNIEISKEPGCRVMIFAVNTSKLIVSQKSTQNLFPGYGLRFIDTPSFKTSTFLHASAKPLRDISLSSDENLLSVASLEPKVKLFDMRVKAVVSQFSPGDKSLWACAMDQKERDNFLYLGAQQGSTYIYDIRFPESIALEFKTEGDLSPVINIAPVPANKHFSSGGFLVCKLQSLWFYEYTMPDVTPTRLNAEGPFISMSYDSVNETVLLFARSSARYPQSRYIVGKLERINEFPIFAPTVTFFGSKTTPVMTRCSQIAVEKNTLVAGYIQDSKLLSLFDVKRSQRLQSMPVQEVVYDTCPVYMQNSTYLAALTETKCRIYKLTST